MSKPITVAYRIEIRHPSAYMWHWQGEFESRAEAQEAAEKAAAAKFGNTEAPLYGGVRLLWMEQIGHWKNDEINEEEW